MGVPGFFAWLIKQYKNKEIVTPNITGEVDILYLDSNCLFHPQCHKVLDHYKDSISVDLLETKMIRRIINYIEYLIEYINPNRVYISVDGVAPMAKMIQQRKRRYRAVDDNIIKDDIKKKYGIKTNNKWNNTVITPGTEFMEKLHNAILNYIKKNKKRKIYYSSYHSCGEGEHKILEDIRNNNNNSDKKTIIYGLDADLIFLSLASCKKNLYLLREAGEFGGKKEVTILDDIVNDVNELLNFVSIDILKECFNDKITSIITDLNSINTVDYRIIDFTNDFIFICYLLGNDFLPPLPSIDIKTGGLDFLLKCYADVYLQLNVPIIDVTKNVTINSAFLDMFLKRIAISEEYYFQEILPKHLESCNRRSCFSSDPCERELWDLENLRNMDIYDPIQLGYDSPHMWKYRYYQHYFQQSSQQYKLVDELCKEYITGLIWVAQYYLKGCPSWDWYYRYSHPPFVSDLSKYFTSKKIDINKIIFQKSTPTTPCIQLLTVLPPSCSNILPQAYRPYVLSKKSPLIDMFPENVELDMINKDSFWKCIPMLPDINADKIKYTLKEVKLTKEEEKRNKILNIFTN